jgi:protein ImuB
VIACLSIPGLELKAALLRTPTLALRPAALAPEPQGEPLIGPVTAAAEAAGVRPGMRLGEALATCPSLVLVDPDAAGAERAWEEIVRSLEDAGFSVETASLGVAYFETRESSGSTAVSSRRCDVRSLPSGRSGTRASAQPGGASPRSPRHPSRVRGRRSSSPTRSCRSSSRLCP